jgi:hypothetical protein
VAGNSGKAQDYPSRESVSILPDVRPPGWSSFYVLCRAYIG